MFQAIAAIVQSVLGFATGINNTANQQYLVYRGEAENSIQYSRAKNMAFYDAYRDLFKWISIIIIIALITLTVVYFNRKRK